jgi:hypothetical protein
MSHQSSKRIPIIVALLAVLSVAGGVVSMHLMRVFAAEPRRDTSRTPAAVAGKPARQEVLKSTLAGTWYKGDPSTLRADLAGYFEKAQVDPKADVVALILPHAGYEYSGPTAAYGV